MLDKLRCIPFIVAALAVLAVFMGAARNEGPEPEAYVLMEADTRSVLNEKNADKRLNAGYLSKLMGILLIAEDIESGKYSADDELTASESVTNTKGAVIWLESGDKMTVDELP